MKRQNLVWLALFLFGAIGLASNALLRPHGFGKAYVRDVTRSFVEVQAGPPIGGDPGEATRTIWVPADSDELHRPNIARTAAAPISWTVEEQVTPAEAWKAMAAPGGGGVRLSWAQTIGIWVAAFFTLAVFSFLWKDNPVYKFTESVIVGVSAAYWMVNAFWSTLVPNLIVPLLPASAADWPAPGSAETDPYWWVTLIPLVLSVMLLLRLSSKGGWIAAWPLAFVIGTTAGMKLLSHVQADFLAMIASSTKPLVVMQQNGAGRQFEWGESVGNAVLLLGLLTVLTYFFFSVEHRGAVGKVARVGVWFLMVSFGSAFAFTVMGRITLLSERFEFLFNDWLWLIDPKGAHTAVSAAASFLTGPFAG